MMTENFNDIEFQDESDKALKSASNQTAESNPEILQTEENGMTEHIEQLEMVSDAANQAVDALTKGSQKMSLDQIEHVKGVLEALLFVNEKPISLEQIRKALPTVSSNEVKKLIFILSDEYSLRKCGMTIVEIADGYQMLSNPLYASYVRNFYQTKHKEKLSKPALETLAIIAYKQPVSRADIEQIRGVNTDGVFVHLLNKELIKVVGRKEVPGRPFIYGTTKEFLEYFGLKSLESLPKLEELVALQEAAEKTQEEVSQETVNAKSAAFIENGGMSQADQVDQTDRAEEIMNEIPSSLLVGKAEEFLEESKEI